MTAISPVSRTLLLAPLVLLLLAALAWSTSPRPSDALDPVHPAFAAPLEQVSDPLTSAERLRRDGDVEAAANAFRALLDGTDQAMAEEARARLIGMMLNQRKLEAAAELARPMAQSSSTSIKDRATFVLAEIARAEKRCAEAIPGYQALIERKALLEPYARFGLIACAEEGERHGQAAEQAQAILQTEPHRRLRIEALERLAAAELRQGNPNRHLQIYDELLTLGATRVYRGTVLWTAAEVARNVGNQEFAVQKLSALVREYPEHPRAGAALDALNALQAVGGVTWTQAAMVRLSARQTEAAQDGFEKAIAEAPDGPEAALARYQRASLILRDGRETEAAREMRVAGERHPEAAIAPTALLRAGRIIESNGGLEEARQIYTRLATVHAGTNQGRQGRFRLGLVHYLRGDYPGALNAWEPLSRDAAERELQALGLLWQAKAHRQLRASAEADAHLQRTMAIGPDTFAGFRARAILAGDASSAHTFRPLTLPLPPAGNEAHLEEWLNANGTSQAELAEITRTEPMYQRAIELWRLGMREQAFWEFDGLNDQARASDAPLAKQYWLAATQLSLGLTSAALRTAEVATREHGVIRTTLPGAFQRVLMPLAFESHLAQGSQRHGADPLLFAALVRQESRWEPSARSSANALGLSQIVPGTGRTIAGALGNASFSEADLLNPATNLDYGAYYLARQLQRYGGLVLPALAAYNAGGGAVDRWINELGRDDMDLFAARIPYSETNYYLQVVFENYGLYRAIYRGE